MDRLRLLLRHVTIWGMIAAITVGCIIVARAGQPWLWVLVLLGVPAQMLNEYNLHRHIFHLKPPRAQWAFDLLYRAHYGHHDFPTNRELIFAPDFVVFPGLVINFTLVWGILTLLGTTSRNGSTSRRVGRSSTG
jgi:hypothetical protein